MTFGKGVEKIEVVFVKPKPQPQLIEGRRIDEPLRLLDWPPSVH